MPATKEPCVELASLPDVLTPSELAGFERVDVRVIRAELEAGHVPGAYRRGSRWRILRDTYLAVVAANEAGGTHE